MSKQFKRLVGAVAVLALLLGLIPFGGGDAAAQADQVYFPQTGKTLRGGFLSYWSSHGGLAQQGYPITDEYPEVNSVDGKTYTTQYFERARFEFHPEYPNNQVLLGLLGREALVARYGNVKPDNSPVNPPGSGSVSFPQTGHTLSGIFLNYWQSHGGLAQQGYPLTEPFNEVSQQNGQIYITQYFERARFEYHPEYPNTPVLLGLLGDEIYQRKQNPAPVPTATPLAATPTPSVYNVAPYANQVTIPGSGGTAAVRADCPQGSVPLGGGWGSNTSVYVYESRADANGWLVRGQTLNASNQLLSVYVRCLSGISTASITQVSADAKVTPGGDNRAFIKCGDGLLTGGGFSMDIGALLGQELPTRGGWLVGATNSGPGNKRITAIAVCLKNSGLNASIVSDSTSLSGSTAAKVTTFCGNGTLLAGGGFDTDGNPLVFHSLPSNNGWEVWAQNVLGSGTRVTSTAICVSR